MAGRGKLAAGAAGAVGVGALAVGALRRWRWRRGLGEACVGFAEDIMPSVVDETPHVPPPLYETVAHAKGHRHLRLGRTLTEEPAPPVVRERPFAKHQHGARHPGRG